MIRVYWLDCSALMDEAVLENALPYLGAERREKTLRLQTAERRAQSAAAGLLLRHLFGDTEHTYGTNGKPYLLGREDLFFSLSHSGKYVVCAVAECEIGVDIEPVSPIRPAVVRRCFNEAEQAWIGEDAARFTRLWTMKEAYMKLTGTGLSVPAKSITLPIPPQYGYDDKNRCYWFFPTSDIPISICANESDHMEVIVANLKDLL